MESSQLIQLALALALVLGLMGLFGFILKKLNFMQSGMTGKDNRLKIVEQRMIDSKSRTVLIRCDTTEYLVLMSNNGNIILDSGIKTPKETAKKNMELL